MGIHRGEKPFSCSHCPYSSRLKSSLLQHLRTHTGNARTKEFHHQVRYTPVGQCSHGVETVFCDCVQVSGPTGAPSARTLQSIAALCSDTAGLTVRRSRTGVNTVTTAGNMHARTPVIVKRQLSDLISFSAFRRRAWTSTHAAIIPLSCFHANSVNTPVPIDSCCYDMSANTTLRPSMLHCDRPSHASAGGPSLYSLTKLWKCNYL